jgi:two-component system alkaline phosphatase synthesis response regulator PhoP
MTKLLIIEDDLNIRELIAYNLREEGYECTLADDGASGLSLILDSDFDLVILDLMLPKMIGLDVLKAVREQGKKTPIIILTAKSSESDKVEGLELGADDYIVKPFGLRELKARIKTAFKHSGSEGVSSPTGNDKSQANGRALNDEKNISKEKISGKASEYSDNISLDIDTHEVRIDGELVSMTLKEFQLLKTLIENRGRVLTREILLDEVWGYDYLGETRTVDVHIRYLRKKIGRYADRIETIRGLGYKLK